MKDFTLIIVISITELAIHPKQKLNSDLNSVFNVKSNKTYAYQSRE